jgi:drug/metabolite transporter (DMT)-like permease
MLVAVAATLCWTAGSLYARGAPLPKAPLLGSGMQQMVGGLVILAVAIAAGELSGSRVDRVSTASWLGLLWLIVAGSFVGFSAYLWLLRNVRTSLVSTYAYVNPVVAVTLGWLVLDEPVTGRLLIAAAIILSSVALIVSAGGSAQRQDARDTPVSELPADAWAGDSGDELGAEVEPQN